MLLVLGHMVCRQQRWSGNFRATSTAARPPLPAGTRGFTAAQGQGLGAGEDLGLLAALAGARKKGPHKGDGISCLFLGDGLGVCYVSLIQLA